MPRRGKTSRTGRFAFVNALSILWEVMYILLKARAGIPYMVALDSIHICYAEAFVIIHGGSKYQFANMKLRREDTESQALGVVKLYHDNIYNHRDTFISTEALSFSSSPNHKMDRIRQRDRHGADYERKYNV